MSMLKKLKNIFVVEDESDNTTNTSGSNNSDELKPPSPATNQKIKFETSGSSKKPDTKFVNLLLKAIEENNIDGFDYLEFKQSVQSLSKVEPDESKRFKNAYAMANAMGLTKNKLFSSAKHYVAVLDREEKKFSEAFNAQKEKQVSDRKTRGEKLKAAIKNKEEQLKKIQAEIASHKKQLASVEADITKALAKVEATKEGFYGAYHMVLKQIKGDLDKITEHID